MKAKKPEVYIIEPANLRMRLYAPSSVRCGKCYAHCLWEYVWRDKHDKWVEPMSYCVRCLDES